MKITIGSDHAGLDHKTKIIQTLEKLTYQKLGDLSELDVKASAVDNQRSGDMKDEY